MRLAMSLIPRPVKFLQASGPGNSARCASGGKVILQMMKGAMGRGVLGLATRANTVIGVVATNAKLNKAQATKVAQMAQDGVARAIRPAHTMLDGDVLFALSTGTLKADVSTIGAFAAEVMAQAIVRAAKMASPAGGLPGFLSSSQ